MHRPHRPGCSGPVCHLDCMRIDNAVKVGKSSQWQSQLVRTVQDCYLTFFLTELAGATAMIFTRTCDNTRKLALMLRNLGFDALPIHGQMSQPKRLGALNKFKGGDRNILVATGEEHTEMAKRLPIPKYAVYKCNLSRATGLCFGLMISIGVIKA